jgi:hypothetical protein
MEPLYTLREYAEKTGRPYSFWWALSKANRLPVIRTAGKIFVRHSAVEQWMAAEEAASLRLTVSSKEYGALRRVD